MKLLTFTSLLTLPLTLAHRFTPFQPELQDPNEQPSYIRVQPDNKPWGGRAIVPLTTTFNLGLENFTIHPATPPVHILPVKLGPDSTGWVLKVVSPINIPHTPYTPSTNTNMADKAPANYIAAVYNPTAKHVSMQIISTSDLTSSDSSVDCLEGKQCVLDGWILEAGVLSYVGFEGTWGAVKDASPGGWSVYWGKEDWGSGGIVLEVGFDGDRSLKGM